MRVRVHVPLVGFTYFVFTCMSSESKGACIFGGVYVPCIYLHAR